MVVLTIYTNEYDSREDIVGNGMSGKVFLEGSGTGREFKTVDEALDHCVEHGINIDQLAIMYLSADGGQKFMRFAALTHEIGK